ncbi:MAG TPA: hypothetical protein VGN51_11285 [Acidimicrobiia bacterium]
MVVAAVLALSALLTATPVTAVAKPERAAERVLVISLPHVSWSDLEAHGPDELPNLHRLLDASAVADLSIRAPRIRPDLAGGYATLSAGDKAVASGTPYDGAGFTADEPVGVGTAADAFARRTGTKVTRGLVQLGLPQIDDANADSDYDAETGALGDALEAAGFSRAVIGNADGVELPAPDVGLSADDAALSESSRRFRREAVIGLMDSRGTVPRGRVDRELLQDHAGAAFGRRLDPEAVVAAFDEVWKPRSVVLVEASDLVRADAYIDLVASGQRDVMFERALRSSDAMIGALLDRVDPAHDAVVVVGPAASPVGGVLTVAAVRAPGVEPGLLRSGTTQRAGFVQLMDMGPTVLDLVGVERPTSMRGRPVEVAAQHGTAADRLAFLADSNDASTFRVRIVNTVPNVWILLASLFAAVSAIALARPGMVRTRSRLPWCASALLAYVPIVYLARLFPFHDIGLVGYWLFVVFGAMALGSAVRVAARGRAVDAAIAGLGTLVAVLVVDVILGNPLQFNSALGFSPSVAGRFIGFGNAAYAALAAAAVLLAGLLAYRVGGRRGAWCGVGVLTIALLADGAPFWGADVGGVLSMVPAFGATAVLLLGIRVRARTVAGIVGAAVAALALATLFDLRQPSGHRRHLARLVEQIQNEGFGAFTDVVRRKLQQNLASFTTSNFRWLTLVALGFLASVLWRPPHPLASLMRRMAALQAALVGFAILAILGDALNDAGVVVPGLMLGVLVTVLVPLLVEEEAVADESERVAVDLRAA